MVIFDYRLPHPALREYVRQYQMVGLSFRPDEVVPVKPYWPRPENCLSFYPLGGDDIIAESKPGFTNPVSTVNGQFTALINRKPPPAFMLIQIVFQPGGLTRLSDVPSEVLSNSFIDAESIFPSEIKYVNMRLSSTNNPTEMMAIVEKFLFWLLKRQKDYQSRSHLLRIDRIGALLLEDRMPFSLERLAEEACLSPRQFYNLFIQRAGINPKLFSRIARFDRTVKLRNIMNNSDWLSIALESGYYDHQHLVKDFKEFTGLSPTAFINKENNAPERRFGNVEK